MKCIPSLKFIAIISELALILILVFANAVNNQVLNTTLPAIPKGRTIVVDPGHGGYDPGKVGVNNVLEKDINLKIALFLEKYLVADGYKVVMIRSFDTSLNDENCSNKKTNDLNHRIDIIKNNNADIAVSIHQNSFEDSSVKGAQVFYYSTDNTNTSSKLLATSIQDSLINNLDPDNKRSAKANNSYFMLKKTPCPAVIVESGFLSNPFECSLLNSEKYQMQIAKAICIGINNYFNSTT